jgi:hypothetical protein
MIMREKFTEYEIIVKHRNRSAIVNRGDINFSKRGSVSYFDCLER